MRSWCVHMAEQCVDAVATRHWLCRAVMRCRRSISNKKIGALTPALSSCGANCSISIFASIPCVSVHHCTYRALTAESSLNLGATIATQLTHTSCNSVCMLLSADPITACRHSITKRACAFHHTVRAPFQQLCNLLLPTSNVQSWRPARFSGAAA